MSSLIPYDDARSLLLAANLVPLENVHITNEPFYEPQGSNWLSIDCYSNSLNILDLGANKWQERGTFIVYCCGPINQGTDSLRTLAKNVCNIYRGMGPRNPYYHGCSIGSGGQSDEGGYFVIPVTVEFIYED